MRVAFLIRSLEVGGAQVQMSLLARGLLERGHEVTVVSFYSGGRIAEELESAGVRVISLDKSGRWDVFGFVRRMAKTLAELQPDILHSYLPVANLMTRFMARTRSRGTRIVWGIRASHRDLAAYDWTWRVVDRLEALISKFPGLVICNSNAGKTRCHERGFRARRIEVVHNGVDTDRFCRDEAGRQDLRKEWGLDEGQIAIGLVGRLDPVKRHDRFLRAIVTLQSQRADVYGIVVGAGSDPQFVGSLHHLAETLEARIIWVNERADLNSVYSALDVTVCCSSSEGFPNVAAEAMACGTPVIGTRVGDLEVIVKQSGQLVSNDDDGTALAHVLATYLDALPDQPESLRKSITSRFSVEAMIDRTEKLLCELR